MKTLQKTVSVFLMTLCLCLAVLPIAAFATDTYNGLEVTVEMDKEYYEDGEPITATITVVNTNRETVTVANLEQLIPEGYVLSDNSEASLENVTLQPGKSLVLQVTFEGDTTQTDAEGEESTSFVDTLLYGQTWGISNLLIAVIVVIAFVVFMILT